MEIKAIMVMTTVPSQETGEQIARTLLEKKLAACISFIPSIRSLYIWKGQVCNEEEILLIIKSRADLFPEQIVGTIKTLHPYEIPEIIALPIVMGSEDYLKWIGDVTGTTPRS